MYMAPCGSSLLNDKIVQKVLLTYESSTGVPAPLPLCTAAKASKGSSQKIYYQTSLYSSLCGLVNQLSPLQEEITSPHHKALKEILKALKEILKALKAQNQVPETLKDPSPPLEALGRREKIIRAGDTTLYSTA